MVYTTTLTRWGNSQGIRLPAQVCRQLGLAAGDKLQLSILDSGGLVISASKKKYARSSPGVTIDDLFRGYKGGFRPDGESWGSDLGAEVVE
ncbi:MAG: AbrB/MazE/SpoVT family DNA-binding domain-containing protein [Coriobacteriia bacterium]|nr:AbrB/MazE/SpoVT family DNA-binding domain-containing protein [Coriobacteriia bacterium]